MISAGCPGMSANSSSTPQHRRSIPVGCAGSGTVTNDSCVILAPTRQALACSPLALHTCRRCPLALSKPFHIGSTAACACASRLVLAACPLQLVLPSGTFQPSYPSDAQPLPFRRKLERLTRFTICTEPPASRAQLKQTGGLSVCFCSVSRSALHLGHVHS